MINVCKFHHDQISLISFSCIVYSINSTYSYLVHIYNLLSIFYSTYVFWTSNISLDSHVGTDKPRIDWLIAVEVHKQKTIKGQVSKETVLQRWWGVLQDSWVLSTRYCMCLNKLVLIRSCRDGRCSNSGFLQ